jgi:hypothetical protein
MQIRVVTRCLTAICLTALVLGLIGCAGNQDLSRTEPRSGMPKSGVSEWKGPIVQRSHWRNLFYGYDTVTYRLIGREGLASRNYGLSITVDYGGNARNYSAARFSSNLTRPTAEYRHDVGRCQFFNNLIYACLYRDRFTVPLAPSELDRASTTGLRFTLQSPTRDYETLELPADYIRRFLAGFDQKFPPKNPALSMLSGQPLSHPARQ